MNQYNVNLNIIMSKNILKGFALLYKGLSFIFNPFLLFLIIINN